MEMCAICQTVICAGWNIQNICSRNRKRYIVFNIGVPVKSATSVVLCFNIAVPVKSATSVILCFNIDLPVKSATSVI